MTSARPWHLVADIGGTNARFAAAAPDSAAFAVQRTLAVGDAADFFAALQAFLGTVAEAGGWHGRPAAACLAVAAPVQGPVVQLTNAAWSIDGEACAAQLGLERVALINDFAAVGHAIPALGAADLQAVGGGRAAPGEPVVVLGPGTGLGLCSVLPGSPPRVIAGEGGHVDLPVVTDEEIELLRTLRVRFGRVSAERVVSGPGLANIHAALAPAAGVAAMAEPAAITRAALGGEDAVAGRALALFCALLGAFAGNAALTLGARGGVYIAGGIAPQILPALAASDFRERFVAKGRYRAYLEAIPTSVVLRPDLGLVGALRYLESLTGSRAGARWDDPAPPCGH